MKKILLVDDDSKFLKGLTNLLKSRYEITSTTSPVKGLKMLVAGSKFDMIILDLYMEKIDGLTFIDLLEDTLEKYNILVLSGAATVDKQLEILDSIAIDFIDKAVPPEVLLKRIEKLLLKAELENTSNDILESKQERLIVDKSSRGVCVDGEPIPLQKKEYLLLKLLLSSKNKVLSREEIYEEIWGEELITSNLRIVDINILKLRKKLGINSIRAERGIGYVWQESKVNRV